MQSGAVPVVAVADVVASPVEDVSVAVADVCDSFSCEVVDEDACPVKRLAAVCPVAANVVADEAGESPGGVLVVLADAVVLAGDAIDAQVAEDKVVDVGDGSGRAGNGSGRTGCAEIVTCNGRFTDNGRPWFCCSLL